MTKRTTRALLWMVLDVGGGQFLSFVIYVILARILTPADYGVFSLAMAVISIGNIVLLQGVGEALIQREEVDEADLCTAFWSILGVGVLITLILFLLAHPLALVFRAPGLAPVLRWMSLICILRALVAVHTGLCRRSLHLAVFATRAILSYLAGGAAGIALALTGYGVWALVASQLGQAAMILLVMWTAVPWRPRFRFSWPAFVELSRFCRHYMAATVISSCADKTDNLVIGLMLNVTAVGYYALALKVLQTLSMLTLGPIRQVLMPVLSRLVGNRAAFADQYVQLITAANAAFLPGAAAIGATAPVLLPLAFGAHWSGAVPVLQAMCLAGPTYALWALGGEALSSFGRPDLYARLSTAQLAIATTMFVLVSPFGIVAAGLAWAAISASLLPLSMFMLVRCCGLPVLPLLANGVRFGIAGLAMAGAMAAIANTGAASVRWLLMEFALGLIVYVSVLELVAMPGYASRSLRGVLAVLPNWRFARHW